jgi:hypothetical protein
VKRPTMLLSELVDEILKNRNLPSAHDVATLQRRVEHEGDSFLSITLPSLGSALELGLETGSLCLSSFLSFRKASKATLPAFLQGLFRLVFDVDGRLRDDADWSAIADLRMILCFMKKPKALCSEDRTIVSFEQFIATENDLELCEARCSGHDALLRRVSDLLWKPLFKEVTNETFISSHGPGATAERLSKNDRLAVRLWNHRSTDTFPPDLHVIPNFGWHEDLEGVSFLSPRTELSPFKGFASTLNGRESIVFSDLSDSDTRNNQLFDSKRILCGCFGSLSSETVCPTCNSSSDELPVRVITVPKTRKSPRIIAIEPSHMMFMQQGVKDYLYSRLESYRLTRNSIRFKDQGVNRHNARVASVSKAFCTMDLSEASDRVSYSLVRNIFGTSRIWPYLHSSRTTHAMLPTEKLPIKLRKFASMGSALCFPVEAMVFYTVIQCALHHLYGRTPTSRSILQYSNWIDVYGDDIIVPSGARVIVTQFLEAYGLKVNASKTFSEGNFRESCGGDYFRGQDVTPVYLRVDIPDCGDHVDPEVLMSLVSTSNQLYKLGYWRTCRILRSWIEGWVRCKIPLSPFEGDGLTFYSYRTSSHLKWNERIQGFAQKRICFSPVKQADPVSDSSARLFAGLSNIRGPIPSYALNKDYGEPFDFDRSVKRGVFKVKRRWVPALIGRAVP